MSLKNQKGLILVPFNAAWINHDKIDVHAIYERPRFKQDEYGEWEREIDKDGLQTWDLTGPLPVKSHNKYLAKGFRYVTLADAMSLMIAGQQGTVQLQENMTTWREYMQHQTGGPWNYKKYAEGIRDSHTRDAEVLRADVLRFGAEAVEQIRRQTDATFVLPDELRKLGTPAVVVPEVVVPPTPAPVEAAPVAAEVAPERPRGNGGKYVKANTAVGA